jgi:pilus assembly protein CpaE
MKSPVLKPRRPLVALFSADAALRSAIVGQLAGPAAYEVTQGDVEAFVGGRGGQAKPAVIILDIGDGTILSDTRLEAARARSGATPIIVISRDMPPERARQLMRLRAVDWLEQPFEAGDLSAALARATGVNRSADSKVVTFVSASGGAGATTLALLAAQFLADRSTPGQTCLVDLDFQQANCGAYLNLVNEFDLGGVAMQPDRLDAELLETIKLERSPKLALYSFERPDLSFAPTGRDFVLRLLDLAALAHQQIVIDLPRLETPWFGDVVRGSDIVFVVFELNVPSLRQARHVVKRVREARGNGDKVIPIASKNSFKLIGNPISRKDVAKVFTTGEVFSVGRDDALAGEALNRGMMPSEISRRSKLVREAEHVFRTVLPQ